MGVTELGQVGAVERNLVWIADERRPGGTPTPRSTLDDRRDPRRRIPPRVLGAQTPELLAPNAGPQRLRAVNPRIAQAVTQLGFRMQAELSASGRGTVVSGANTAQFLAMMVGGASPDQARRLLDGIGLGGMSTQDALLGFRAIAANLAADRQGVQFRTANAVWADQGVRLDADFVRRLRRDFGGTATTLPLATGAHRINTWAAENTNNLIPEVVNDRDLANAYFVATSALAFRGTWATAFDPRFTQSMEFASPGGPVQVPTMYNEAIRGDRHVGAQGFSAARLPYQDGQTSLLVIVPEDGDTASVVRALATPEGRARYLDAQNYRPASGSVHLPRFSTTAEHDLIPVLRSLNIPGTGPYTNVTGRPLSFDVMRQRARIDVHELGTDAGAVVTGISERSARLPRTLIDARQPFVYAVVDNRTGLVTFNGVFNGR